MSANSDEVAAWMLNDEAMYDMVNSFLRRRTKDQAARDLLDYWQMMGLTHTPYSNVLLTFTNVREALKDFDRSN